MKNAKDYFEDNYGKDPFKHTMRIGDEASLFELIDDYADYAFHCGIDKISNACDDEMVLCEIKPIVLKCTPDFFETQEPSRVSINRLHDVAIYVLDHNPVIRTLVCAKNPFAATIDLNGPSGKLMFKLKFK